MTQWRGTDMCRSNFLGPSDASVVPTRGLCKTSVKNIGGFSWNGTRRCLQENAREKSQNTDSQSSDINIGRSAPPEGESVPNLCWLQPGFGSLGSFGSLGPFGRFGRMFLTWFRKPVYPGHGRRSVRAQGRKRFAQGRREGE